MGKVYKNVQYLFAKKYRCNVSIFFGANQGSEPPWVEFTPDDPKAVVLELEAKTAFGTGEHDTTSSGATLMGPIDFKGKTVLDIGTDTGI